MHLLFKDVFGETAAWVSAVAYSTLPINCTMLSTLRLAAKTFSALSALIVLAVVIWSLVKWSGGQP